MVHGIGMHVMHHIIIMCSSSCSSCSSLIIIDHHHVRCSLINDQSLNIDCCSLINVDHLLCEHERVRVDEWMSGWCPSSSVCGMAVVRAAAVLPGAVCVARALLIPLQCWRVLLSCRALFHCRVCGVWVVSVCVLFVWWGILCALPPHSGGGWGHRGWWGVCCGGGWHDE